MTHLSDLHSGHGDGPPAFFWNDADGDTGSIRVDSASTEVAVLEIQSRDRKEAEGVWLTPADAARLSAWLDRFVAGAVSWTEEAS